MTSMGFVTRPGRAVPEPGGSPASSDGTSGGIPSQSGDASLLPIAVRLHPLALLAAMAVLAGQACMAPAQAQVEKFTLKRGSSVGPATKIEPTNCVTNPTDGSVTCDTKVVNPQGDTPAKPSYTPFSH